MKELLEVPWGETTLNWEHYPDYDPATDGSRVRNPDDKTEEKEGDIIIQHDSAYCLEPMTRRDTIDRPMQLIMDMMELLARYCGDENVRLVVWFDD